MTPPINVFIGLDESVENKDASPKLPSKILFMLEPKDNVQSSSKNILYFFYEIVVGFPSNITIGTNIQVFHIIMVISQVYDVTCLGTI